MQRINLTEKISSRWKQGPHLHLTLKIQSILILICDLGYDLSLWALYLHQKTVKYLLLSAFCLYCEVEIG